ncbi:MAG: pyridoxal phosphate-dependent aminotransferase [Planctomycetota bacterium]|nr:pyridoxal phosphate-dependent aminotransferase [Planctomycetota bacterium]
MAKEPALTGSLNRDLRPNPSKQWDPWHEESPDGPPGPRPAAPALPKPAKEPALNGVVKAPGQGRKSRTWNPWTESHGIAPPAGYPSDSAHATASAPVAPPAPAPASAPVSVGTPGQPRLAQRLGRLGTETAFDVLARVNKLKAEGKSIVSFALGEPDFETPEHIRSAAKKAIDQGHTHYVPSAGIEGLRKAIADYVSRSRKISARPEQVVVGPGAKPILFDAMLALVDEGDEVIYPNPGYPIYESIADFLGAKAVPLPLVEARQFRIDPAELAKLITPRTKVLIVNSPANPTGGVLQKDDLCGIAELARKHNFWVIADEIYSEILYVPEYASILQCPGMADRTVLIDGFSKTFAMTGWRLGFGVMPAPLAVHVARIETNIDSCTAAFTQIAGIEALEGPWHEARRFRDEFKKRRDAIVDGLNAIKGITCLRPEGAFYAFPNVTQACKNLGCKDAEEFQDRAMVEAGVALLARTRFGRKNAGEDQEYVRLSYATSLENIQEGLKRLKAFCER